MSCAICETRKEKRFCPAVHARICPTCCGTEREVSLDCPSDCVYLRQARQNERERGFEQVPGEALFSDIEVPQSFAYEREPLIAGLCFAIAKIARADRLVRDTEVIAALGAMVRTYQRLAGSGLIYDEPSANPLQHALNAELQKMIAEYRATEEKHRGYSTLRDTDVLRALVFIVRMALMRTSGRPKSRAFVDFLFAQFPEKSSTAGAGEAASRIVVP